VTWSDRERTRTTHQQQQQKKREKRRKPRKEVCHVRESSPVSLLQLNVDVHVSVHLCTSAYLIENRDIALIVIWSDALRGMVHDDDVSGHASLVRLSETA